LKIVEKRRVYLASNNDRPTSIGKKRLFGRWELPCRATVGMIHFCLNSQTDFFNKLRRNQLKGKKLKEAKHEKDTLGWSQHLSSNIRREAWSGKNLATVL